MRIDTGHSHAHKIAEKSNQFTSQLAVGASRPQAGSRGDRVNKSVTIG
jgi:hypothetical protein